MADGSIQGSDEQTHSTESAHAMEKPVSRKVHVVGIGGTTRSGSSTERILRYALRLVEERGASTTGVYGETLLSLPMYSPDSSYRSDEALGFIEIIRSADGLILASPGYHGAISGLVKNALDYVEDLRDDNRCYLEGLPVGCIATGAGSQAVVTTLLQLQTIVHALRGWPTPLGATIITTSPLFDDDGVVVDQRASFQLSTIARDVAEFASGNRDRVQSTRPTD